MRVVEFNLINEKGQEYSLMDIQNYCLLTDPNGLGYSYSSEYKQIGNTYVETFRSLDQGKINGKLNFISYDNFFDFVNFVEGSESLKISCKIPFKSRRETIYYKDVKIQILDKTEKVDEKIVEPVTFECLSIWYEENTYVYEIRPERDEIRWDFRWDSKFTDYSTRTLSFKNEGHVEAPIELELNGYILNPIFSLFVEGQLVQEVKINVEILEYEKLLYGTKENNFYISKQRTDGTIESLFSSDCINPENDNVIRFPKGKSCELKMSAENDVLNAIARVYPGYRII